MCSRNKENEMVVFTSFEEKLSSPIGHVTATSPNEGHINVSPQNSPIQKTTFQGDKKSFIVESFKVITPTNSSPQVVETPVKLISPTTKSLLKMPSIIEFSNLNTLSSPLETTSPKTTTSMNKRYKSEKPSASSNGKVSMSKYKSKKKKTHVHHQDARTMVFVHSNTHVAYNNGLHFANRDLTQEISQHNPMMNVINPSFLYDFVESPQPTQTPLMHDKTEVHLMHAQNSAKDAMIAATSALAQSHCEWSHMQTQV